MLILFWSPDPRVKHHEKKVKIRKMVDIEDEDPVEKIHVRTVGCFDAFPAMQLSVNYIRYKNSTFTNNMKA